MKMFMKVFLFFMLALGLSTAHAATQQQVQTVDLVKKYFDAINKKDMDGFFAIMSNDVIHDINQDGSEKGVEKFKQFMEKANASFDEKLSDIVIMISEDGKQAAAKWIDHGKYFKDFPGLDVKAHNQTYKLAGGHFFEIKHGKISRVTTYYNTTEFMKQIKK